MQLDLPAKVELFLSSLSLFNFTGQVKMGEYIESESSDCGNYFGPMTKGGSKCKVEENTGKGESEFKLT